jgi:MFS family permease
MVLHGPSFAAFYVAGITFVDSHVPVALRATGQTLFNAATFGLGSITGSLVFGALADHAGFSRMYAIAGATCVVATTLLALVVRERRR